MSSDVRTERAPTVHGDVEYEVVECCSCENDVAKEDAKRVVAGTVTKERSWSYKNTKEFDFRSRDYSEGWVCPFCYEGGVDSFAGFPVPATGFSLLVDPQADELLFAALWGLMALTLGVMIGGVFL